MDIYIVDEITQVQQIFFHCAAIEVVPVCVEKDAVPYVPNLGCFRHCDPNVQTWWCRKLVVVVAEGELEALVAAVPVWEPHVPPVGKFPLVRALRGNVGLLIFLLGKLTR